MLRTRALAGALVVVALVVTGLVAVAVPAPAGGLGAEASMVGAAGVWQCQPGFVLSDNGVTCEPDPDAPPPGTVCPSGQQLDAAGLNCEPIPDDPDALCPAGQQLDAAGLRCVEAVDESGDETGADAATTCAPGYSLGADGVTCVARGPICGSDEIVDDDGECRRSFQCPAGFILASDLLTCLSDRCPEGELLSLDGKRCVAPADTCPDGSPRPVGGACLVVEKVEGADGASVIVRCDEADLFCQAQVKDCADSRATGGSSDLSAQCEDPRSSCDAGEQACSEANERLVECATRDVDAEGDDAGGDADDGGGRRLDPCEDLCPALHRLDPSGACIEYLDPTHPCVSFEQIPEGVTTNAELDGYSYLAGTGQCVTKVEFLRRLGNFEAAAGAEAEALALLRETTSAYLNAEDRLAELETALVVAEREVRQFTADAADADARRAQAEKDLAQTRKHLVRETALLRAEVVEAYVTGGREQAVEAAMLAASNLTEIGTVLSYGRAVLDGQVDNVARIQGLERVAETLADDLDAAVAEVNEALDEATATTVEIAALIDESAAVREAQLARRGEEAELVALLREDKADAARTLGVFDQASREIADIISESEFLVTEYEDFDGLFANPVIPAEVVSGFGPRLHPILGYVRPHNGLDFNGRFGDSIYASAPGIVQVASSFGGYGDTVVLDHGEFHTLYAHMSVIGAEVGDEVERGDVIGFVGSTGLSTGPHLHFEIWVDGKNPVDPIPYLELSN